MGAVVERTYELTSVLFTGIPLFVTERPISLPDVNDAEPGTVRTNPLGRLSS